MVPEATVTRPRDDQVVPGTVVGGSGVQTPGESMCTHHNWKAVTLDLNNIFIYRIIYRRTRHRKVRRRNKVDTLQASSMKIYERRLQFALI